MLAILLAVTTAIPSMPAAQAAPQVETATQAGVQGCSLEPTTEDQGTDVRDFPDGHPFAGRSYRLHVPAGLPGPEASLVISLHPFISNPKTHEEDSELSRAADHYKFIVAYPEGRFTVWNYIDTFDNPDVAFLRAVVDDISADYCVNPGRVHVEGFSLGAAMAQRMACSAADMFASVVSHATTAAPNSPDPLSCVPSRPTPASLSCGEDDTLGGAAAGTCIPQRDGWSIVLDCPAPGPAVGDSYGVHETTRPCDEDAQIWRRVWTEVGHEYPTGDALDRYHAEMVFFFAATPMT